MRIELFATGKVKGTELCLKINMYFYCSAATGGQNNSWWFSVQQDCTVPTNIDNMFLCIITAISALCSTRYWHIKVLNFNTVPQWKLKLSALHDNTQTGCETLVIADIFFPFAVVSGSAASVKLLPTERREQPLHTYTAFLKAVYVCKERKWQYFTKYVIY